MKILVFFAFLAVFPLVGWDTVSSSRGYIVLPDKHADRQTGVFLNRTAELLKRGMKQSLNADFTVVTESKAPAKGIRIFLGDTQLLKGKGINVRQLKGNRYVILVSGNDLFLAGNDHENYRKRQSAVFTGDYTLGTVKAVTAFMEEHLQTRFLLPGETGIDFGKVSAIHIPDNFRKESGTKLLFSRSGQRDLFYISALNFFGEGNMHFGDGKPAYDRAVPAKKNGKTHPEYFAMTESGKRYAGHNDLCISNPEVKQLLIREVLSRMDRGADMVNFCQNDGFRLCCCENCKKFGNTEEAGEKLWILHRSIAEEVYKLRPGKKLVLSSYFPNWEPPKSFREFPPNVVIELCQTQRSTKNIVAKWKDYKVPGGFALYTYSWGSYNAPGYTVQRSVKYCREFADYYLHKCGLPVIGIYRCGLAGETFGLEAPLYYLAGKLLEHPVSETDAILDDYYKRCFHESAPFMKQFFTRLYESSHAFSMLEGEDSIMPGGWISLTDGRRLLPFMFPPELLQQLEYNLKRAESTAKDPKVLKRLRLVRAQFDYTAELTDIARLYTVFRSFPNWQNFELLANRIEKRNQRIGSWYDAKGKMKPIPGWPELPFMGNHKKDSIQINGRLSAAIREPLLWDIPAIRKSGILPGEQKVLTADGTWHKLTSRIKEAHPRLFNVRILRVKQGIQVSFRFSASSLEDAKKQQFAIFYGPSPDRVQRINGACRNDKAGVYKLQEQAAGKKTAVFVRRKDTGSFCRIRFPDTRIPCAKDEYAMSLLLEDGLFNIPPQKSELWYFNFLVQPYALEHDKRGYPAAVLPLCME